MLGWILFFALMTFLGVSATATELPAPATASIATSLVFSVLLVVSLVVRAIRGHA
jgi:F0F1-type ATP synthase membrane subunit a